MKHIPLMFFTKHNLNYTVPLSEEPESEQDHESVVLLMGLCNWSTECLGGFLPT